MVMLKEFPQYQFEERTNPRLSLPNADVRVSRDYFTTDNGPVTAYVEDIIRGPNGPNAKGPQGFVDSEKLVRLSSTLDMGKLLDDLPDGMTEGDVIGIFMLSMLTECATKTYGRAFQEASEKSNEKWLGKYNDVLWVPDEDTHFVPSKLALMQMGYSEAQLDAEIKQTREKEYHHVDNYNPVMLTGFGMMQEYVTNVWYGGIINFLESSNPDTAQAIKDVRRREGLHTVWYRDMTRFQLSANPGLLPQVVEVFRNFDMPSAELVSKYHKGKDDWISMMNVDMNGKGARDIITLIKNIVGGSTKDLGKFAMEYAEQTGVRIGPLDTAVIHRLLNRFERFGGPGYGFVGDVLMKKAGIEVPEMNYADKARGVIVGAVANMVDLKIA